MLNVQKFPISKLTPMAMNGVGCRATARIMGV
ncbi:IS1-like element transposase, partial [Klebsiella grimontii]